MAKVIKVDNLSKAYQLGTFGTGTISRDLERYWAKVRGKEDPFLEVGEENDRTTVGESNTVWSLKDINFEIEQGDSVGIIGRNGAGKSTLLKILSRITSPTTGSVKVKGRVASLLEVGTGFHPELTGRENIYLNGAILGMRKAEIRYKFDEIVSFSGVQRYIDTPVKRYSSGMYVRLAFAVAAHLESEILIVDEVLSVGDAEFQKKCIGKMDDVSKEEGRTVIFVSHNMTALSNVCSKGILLKNGLLALSTDINSAVKHYLQTDKNANNYSFYWQENEGVMPGRFKFESITIKKGENDELGPYVITLDNSVDIIVELTLFLDEMDINIGLEIFNIETVCVLKLAAEPYKGKGTYRATCKIPANLLNDDIYTINVFAIQNKSTVLLEFKKVIQFEVVELTRDQNWHSKWIGTIRPKIPINIVRL